MPSLRVLGLIGNGIGDEGARAAATVLSMAQGIIGGEAGRPTRGGLLRLYLNENVIGDEGSVALAQALAAQNNHHQQPQQPQHHHHHQPPSRPSPAAAAPAAAAAPPPPPPAVPVSSAPPQPPPTPSSSVLLERLGLSENDIGAAGGRALAAALCRPGGTALEKLCASDNPFGDDAHRRLAALPNAFVGHKPRKHRKSCMLDGRHCRVVVVWKPTPPPLFVF